MRGGYRPKQHHQQQVCKTMSEPDSVLQRAQASKSVFKPSQLFEFELVELKEDADPAEAQTEGDNDDLATLEV